ncbi:VWA domain-containing protein [Georgenia satyanarayanai]|uniref:DUF7927 domain-containing protein n=1 Tax=Georgenia satyanarayanai TaxID=860221 RepID=UPI00203AD7A3|nr:VWA domain-containing protein [Georgenia satyanarayanai]MCM3660803.1 VWA domain-containing protein [Georgenia satyanarayanai]
MPSRHRSTPSPWRRRSRSLLVGLTSLTLVLSGTASLATPRDDAEVADLLTELSTDASLETSDTTVEDPTAEEPAAEEPAAEEPAAEEPAAEEPAAEEPAVEEPAAEEPGAEEPAAEDPAAEAPAADEADQAVTPLLVPPGDPGPGEVKLIVRSGGDRTGTGDENSTATPLEGVDYEFYRITDIPAEGPPDGVLVGQCTTDETGECGIFADLPGSLGDVDAFYAVQTDAPGDWVAPTQWAQGADYIFATGPIFADTPADDRIIELPQSYNDSVAEPFWASVRPNNVAPPQCGLDVAMVVDLSNSVTESSALLDQYKDSANGFIEALTGTPSQVALYTFATSAPADGASNTGLPLTSVATPGSASELTARINGFTPTPAMGGGTNWDRGFHQVAESDETYDIVLFLTDGQPTFHRDRQGPGDVATIAEVNEAILSANAVKATGAQIILVGIGPEAPLPGATIRIPLVSGPTEGVDFFRTDFDDLEQTLVDIASENCAGTLTVVKEVEELDGDVVDGGPGWTFTSPTESIDPASATTDETSAVNFEVSYPEGALSREVTVAETQQEGYELVQVGGANAVCTDLTTGAAVPVVNAGGLGFTVDVPVTDVVSCTVRNAEAPPDYDDLTVAKTAQTSFTRDWDWDIEKVAEEDVLEVPAGEDGTFTYDVTVTPEGPVESGFTVAGTITVTNSNDVPFTGVNVLDSLPAGTCTVTGGTDATVGANSSLTLAYSCTPTAATAVTAGTNTATATWSTAAFPGTSGTATGAADFDFADAEVSEVDRFVTVTDSNYDLSTYPGGNTFDAADGEVVLTYELTWPSTPGECVEFPNTATIENATGPMFAPLVVNESSTEIVTLCAGLDLEVEKNVVVSFDRTYLWEIDKEADETTVTVDPDTGTATADYTVTATPTGSSDAGWAMQGAITVANPNEWLDITADVTDTVDVGGGAVCAVADGEDVLVGAGETVTLSYTCTFVTQPSYSGTNTATATWADTVPTPSTTATGTADIEAADWAQTPINQTITVIDDQTDPANPVPLGPATWNAEGTPTVFTYSLELEGTPGACVEYTNTAWIAQTQQSAEEVVEVCVPDLDVAKRAVSADQLPGGDWLVTYEIDVANPEDYAGVYSLSDTLEYGGGITPTAAAWFPAGDPEAGGEWTEPVAGNPTTVLATDVEIAAGATDTYVVVVTADVAEGVIGTEAGLCDDEELSEGGGFLNAATLTVLDEDETVRACAEPVAPTVEKTPGALVDNDDGTWDVSYTIDVANPDADQAVSYDLSDELDFVEGVDILDASIERDGAVYGDWDGVTGTGVVTGVLLPAATTHTYTVTVTVSLTDVVASDGGLRECGLNGSDAGHGLFNLATITSGNDDYDDDACVPIPDPDMSVDKTAVSANQLPDGTWEVVYEVVASNDSSVGGVYDLSDTLEYGEGITPLTAEWALEGTAVAGEWGGLPGELTTTLADDRPLTGGGSDTYVVTVTAAVATGVTGGEAGLCSGEDGTDGGGFLNAATLTAHGEDDTDRDCLPPAHPDLEKVFDSVAERGDGTWAVSYTIVVDNTASDALAYYQLVDTPRFAEGVTILDQEAWDVTDPEDPQDLDWDGEGPILDLVAIEGGQAQRYEVTFVVEVSAGIPDENLVCDPDGTPGRGFFNRAELRSGNDVIPAEDCGPVGEPAWTLMKSSDPVSGSTVDPGDTITYTVTATPTGDVDPTDLTVTDDLSDVLEHARTTGAIEASVGDVDWDGENLVWDIPRLSETATLTYRVVVDDDAWNVRLRNVVTGEGTPPPVCIECSTAHITPARAPGTAQAGTPGLPPTGAAVAGAALLAALLTAGGLALGTTRRRKDA